MHVFIPRSKAPTNLLGVIKVHTKHHRNMLTKTKPKIKELRKMTKTCFPKLKLIVGKSETWYIHHRNQRYVVMLL